MRRNRINLQPTKEEAPPVTSPAWEAPSDASSPIMPSNMDMGIETQVAEPQPGIPQPAIPHADQPVRRSQRIRRAPERLIETVKPDISLGQRELFNDFEKTLFIFLITVLRRGDVTLLCYA